MALKGFQILAKALARQGIKDFFFLMGGPLIDGAGSCIEEGIRGIDVRHEQGASFMAHAYARVLGRPGVCMAASGPGTVNLFTGIVNAHVDCSPVVAIGGSSPYLKGGKGLFQEMDQVGMMRPYTKWAERVYDPRRIPELVAIAMGQAMAGKPGPTYLDFPGDVLYQSVEEDQIAWPREGGWRERFRPHAGRDDIERVIAALSRAERPIILSGSGILWSDAAAEFAAWIEASGIPFYTTPQGRGVVVEDHPYCYTSARTTAFREADLIMVIGTRLNYVFNHLDQPRFSPDAKVIRIDIDPEELAHSLRADVRVVADAKAILGQLVEAAAGRIGSDTFAAWRKRLGDVEAEKRTKQGGNAPLNDVPIHPLRLCADVADILGRDDILVVDGQEILNFGRQSIPTYTPRHRINSGTFGTMGVGLPFGIGAKAAKPDHQVVVLHGDGSFGMNAMELDTAVRHNLPVLVVVSLNGGWTADPDQVKAGRNLGYTRFDLMAAALGCHAEHVERPGDIRPALERARAAVAAGKTALVNVVTDFRARATTVRFSAYMT